MRSLPLAFLLLLSACVQTPRVRTDFDPAASFASYRTYRWIPVDVPRGMNPIAFRRIQGSIDRALQARGYVPAEHPDFAIAFTVGERDRTESTGYGAYPYWGWGGWGGGWGWGHGWGGWGGWGYPYGSVDVYTVTDRSLVIDIYDERTKAPVWHGTVTRTGYPNDDVNYGNLDANVDAVLSRFPPQPMGAPPPPPQKYGSN